MNLFYYNIYLRKTEGLAFKDSDSKQLVSVSKFPHVVQVFLI